MTPFGNDNKAVRVQGVHFALHQTECYVATYADSHLAVIFGIQKYRGLACGCLKHSPTVCIYTLPPEGPSKADLVVMSVLDEWVALLPIITGAMSTEEGVGQSCQQLVKNMLQKPHLYVPGLVSVDGVR